MEIKDLIEGVYILKNGTILDRIIFMILTTINFLPKHIYEDTHIHSYNITPTYYRNINIEIHEIINIIKYNGGIDKDLTTEEWESEYLNDDKLAKRIALREQQALRLLMPNTECSKKRRI